MAAYSIGPSVTSLCQRLTICPSSPAYSFLRQDEREQIDGILEDLKGVENTWKWIEAQLADAEEKQIHEQSVRLWLHDLREVAYKIEELRDVCEYEVVAREVEAYKATSSSGGTTSSKRRKLEEPHVEVRPPVMTYLSPLVDASFTEQVARDLKTINKEFDAIAKRRKALKHLKKGDGRKHSSNDDFISCEPTGHVPADPVFLGREREMEELRRMLLADHGENVEVIAVTGMGGAGKTTLAQHAYLDGQIESKFEKIGWVHVSESSDVIQLTKGIFEAFTRNSSDCSQLSSLQDKVIRLLEDRKVLLVMDDVWNTQRWESIVALFKQAVEKGSKILVTTRLPEVAAGARSINLEGLSEDHGWSLLKNHAFLNRGDDVDNLEELKEIGKRIVQKCRGLPLSIKLLGRLLRSKGSGEDEWREVSENSLLDFEEEREAKRILGSLYLSYLYLSPKLRSCFKHCAIYPNEIILSRHLKHSWMANHLVKDLKEAAECLGELASRSFLEFQPYKGYTKISMHDHIYDLAQFVLEEKHINLDCDGTFPAQLTEFDFSGSRHACIHFRDISHVTINITLSNLHTLVFSNKQPWQDTWGPVDVHISLGQCLRELIFGVSFMDITADDDIGTFPMELSINDGCQSYLKCLRVLVFPKYWSYIPRWVFQLYNLRYLELRKSQIECLPDDVCDLMNLRCLNLEFSRIIYLPESISRLVNLQELNLHGCQNLKELPKSIISLTNLTILNLQFTYISFMPKGFGALTKLQYLTDFIIDSTQAGIAELKNMKHLEGAILIDNLCEVVSEEDAAQAEMASKKGLRKLLLHWSKNIYKGGLVMFKGGDIYSTYDRYGYFRGTKLVEVLKHGRTDRGKFLLEKGSEEKIARHEEGVFEQLRPHRNIQEVFIGDYRGFKLPSWMGDEYFTKLESIHLYEINYCTSLLPINQLPSLVRLNLECMGSLKELVPNQSTEPVDINIMDLATEKRLSFPKLEWLQVFDCESLELLPLYKFTSLEGVNVHRCSNLEQMEPPYDIPCPLKYISIYLCPKFHFSPDPRFPQPSWELSIG